ncbi:hypothetical protein ILUMI_10676 [Ignelater luminosus]|uniref:Tc1-like transposase DDE domain-containing protein n=1 Tax=Ignelater luminosus TaxID=2038154 RepID=A0A8K0GDY2_IGNLU|nr:hypothetical protein ILUMI_10676 [Ignelater luminosus]
MRPGFLKTAYWVDHDRIKAPRALKKIRVMDNKDSNEFTPEASLIFSSNTKDPDYYGEMNEVNFVNCFEEQLLKSLEESFTVVMDNAGYHSRIINKALTAA